MKSGSKLLKKDKIKNFKLCTNSIFELDTVRNTDISVSYWTEEESSSRYVPVVTQSCREELVAALVVACSCCVFLASRYYLVTAYFLLVDTI